MTTNPHESNSDALIEAQDVSHVPPFPAAMATQAPEQDPGQGAAADGEGNATESSASDRPQALQDATEQACALVPPLWTLRNFVAVNPYLGLTDRPFSEAILEVDRLKHADPLLPLEDFWALHAEGRITEADLDEALAGAASALGRPEIADLAPDVLRERLFERGARQKRVLTFAELVDGIGGGEWNRVIVEEVAKWCAGRFDRGQSSWPQPYLDLEIYPAWKALAVVDRGPEHKGLPGFTEFARSLPQDAEACIAQLTDELGVPDRDLADYLSRALGTVSGWAGHLQYLIRQAGMEGRETADRLQDLLAIRLAFDAAIHRSRSSDPRFASWPVARDHFEASTDPDAPSPPSAPLSELEARHLWQLAYEAGFRRDVLSRFVGAKADKSDAASRPFLQAAFCIDVRSERFRRNLEEVGDAVQTIGFAGFFGLPIATRHAGNDSGEPRCPVLLSPGVDLSALGDGEPSVERTRRRKDQYHTLVKKLRLSSVVAFPFVETIGQFFGLRLITESLGWTRPGPDSRLFPDPKTGTFDPVVEAEQTEDPTLGMSLDQRVEAAAGILTNMGLTRTYASYVLFCGHGSSTTNNPFDSALDCGACGGYPGDINARAAADLLNDPAVRRALPDRGLDVPETTRFVAGLHDTTTDEVRLFDTRGIPIEDLKKIQRWLEGAATRTREERSKSLGAPAGADPTQIVQSRSQDWSEIRPEWGLAGNAAFIAAPRERTRGLDLGGRCFLHDYHADRDPEDSVLELILTAPLVVASWINLQYHGSTVDNEVLGSGSKTIHNVVGRHGVLSGNGGDLRGGLPFQSVHDGERFVHEPLRLTAIVEAERASISKVLEAHEGLRALVENEWIHLVSVEPASDDAYRWTIAGFEEIEGLAHA